MFLKRVHKWWQSRRYFVIADPNDTSITLSKYLFEHIRKTAKEGDPARVFVFAIPQDKTYGFMLNPKIEQETILCDIQVNDKHKTIGFETLCPTVSQIFYDYGLKHDKAVKLSVSIKTTRLGNYYYQFDRPNANGIR